MATLDLAVLTILLLIVSIIVLVLIGKLIVKQTVKELKKLNGTVDRLLDIIGNS